MKNSIQGYTQAIATTCILVLANGCAGSASNETSTTPVGTTTTAAVSSGTDPTGVSASVGTTNTPAGINPNSMTPSTPVPTPPPADAMLTDGQIAEIASKVDLAEIDAGKLALAQGRSPKAKQFAQHMVTAHAAVEAKLNGMLKAQAIVMADSATSNKLVSDTTAQKQTLLGLSGFDFDRSYLTAQLKDHQDVLDLLDSKLIPQAKNPQLKTALESTRAKVVDHIQMAKDAIAALPAQ
jgi:putative membrane protein